MWKDKEKRLKYLKERRRIAKDFIAKFLKEHPCVKCGYSDIRALEFDHLQPENKTTTVSILVNGTSSIERLVQEIAKCQVLCANCHRIKTIDNKDYLHKTSRIRGVESSRAS